MEESQPSFLTHTPDAHLHLKVQMMEPLTEGEAGATLQDVLALLDACEPSSSETSTSPFLSTPVRRDESHSYYRTRNEIEQLRRQAAKLESCLTLLKDGSAPIYEQRLAELKAINAIASQQIERVQTAFQRRQQSERTNRHLKALLAKYVRMVQAIESAFDMVTDEDISLAFNSQRVLSESKTSRLQDAQTLAMLADRLSQLELDVDSVADSVKAEACSTSCHSLRRFEADMAEVFESTSSQPVSCSLDDAHSAIVEKFLYQMAKRKVLLYDQQLSDSHQTDSLQFQHQQQRFDLVSRARMRKLEQPGRVVYLRSAAVTIESEELTVIEDGILLLIQAPMHFDGMDSSPRSVLIGLHRVRADHGVPHCALTSLKERVVHLSCERNGQFLCKIKKLLHESESRNDICGAQV